MAYVVVYTEKGEQVWHMQATAHALATARCDTNIVGRNLISGLRRAFEDAEALEQGLDPERPSEKAMRLSEAEWEMTQALKAKRLTQPTEW